MNRIGGSANCGVAAPAREYEIPQVISSLFGEIERYKNLFCRLSDRIQPVVTPCPPQETTGKLGNGFNTNLASEINSANCLLSKITDDLESLLSRIEL